eukprot:scaffold29011_cov67-Phaeocystis_antarctica.AAC.3
MRTIVRRAARGWAAASIHRNSRSRGRRISTCEIPTPACCAGREGSIWWYALSLVAGARPQSAVRELIVCSNHHHERRHSGYALVNCGIRTEV